MPKHEPNTKDLHRALDQLTPDEATKERVYAEILRRAAESETKRSPWYAHWKAVSGAGSAALACVVVLVTVVHGRLPQNGTSQLEIVLEESAETSTADETPYAPKWTKTTPNDPQQATVTLVSEQSPRESQPA
ncbi:MAG: hypothetical protein LUC50_01640 [Ruminococcus sp.]|nr:hypothetical protein [Ruminococcus sp.]